MDNQSCPQVHLLNAAVVEYQREISRKATLESKTSAYVTFISIILAASIALSIFIFNSFNPKGPLLVYIVLCSVSVLTFSTIAIITSITVFKQTDRENIVIAELREYWDVSEEQILGGLLQSYEETVKTNIKKNNDLVKKNHLVYDTIKMTLTFFIIQTLTFFILIIGG